jgi:hypothetical protein
LAFTLFALNFVPSEKVTSSRRVNVNSEESSLTSQSVASHGTMSPVSGSWSTRVSAICRATARETV